MTHRYHDIAFTDAVQAHQTRQGSRRAYAAQADGPDRNATLTEPEAAFIASRDSFYLASTGATGWPYVQHRGGPAGFVKVLSPTRLAFADFRGNRQYVTLGNLDGDDRVSLFFMDHARRARLKLYGHAHASDDPQILAAVTLPDHEARIERALVIDVAAFDWNCPQHITERFTADEIRPAISALQARIAALEAELATLRQP